MHIAGRVGGLGPRSERDPFIVRTGRDASFARHGPEGDANVSFLAEGLIGVLSFLIRIIGWGHWKVADSFSIRIDYQR